LLRRLSFCCSLFILRTQTPHSASSNPQYPEGTVCLVCHPRAPCQAVGTVSTCAEHACECRSSVRRSTAQTADPGTPRTSVCSKPATVYLSTGPQQSCDSPLIAAKGTLTSCLQSNYCLTCDLHRCYAGESGVRFPKRAESPDWLWDHSVGSVDKYTDGRAAGA